MTLLNLGKLWIKERYQKPGDVFLGIVHRLDRPAAGVILFARTSKSAARLSEQFRGREVRKIYWAVVEGSPDIGQGELRHYLRRQGRSSRVTEGPEPGTQEARLRYRTLSGDGEAALVEIELLTGRHHQIRAQMAALGHPILGDLRYGASAPLPEKQIALLARELGIFHPTQKKWMTFRSPVPKGWPGVSDINPGPPWTWQEMLRLMDGHPVLKAPGVMPGEDEGQNNAEYGVN